MPTTDPPPAAGQWLELSVESSAEAVDAIVEVFRSRGINGVAVEPSVSKGIDEGFTVVDGPCMVKAYIPLDDHSGEHVLELDHALWHLRAFDLSPLSELRTTVVAEEDWANAWKDHFHPVRLGQRIVIKPSWREFAANSDDIVLELDPGMAFGTGLHPTTRMVLEAMETCVLPGFSVFDVGTGSGILAVAAAKLGSASVLAVDTEPVAVRVARENVVLNSASELVTVREGSVEQGNATYDVVLANIIGSVISEMAQDLARVLNPDGVLITSGIIAERLPMVEAAFADANLRIAERMQSDDWFCLIVNRQ